MHSPHCLAEKSQANMSEVGHTTMLIGILNVSFVGYGTYYTITCTFNSQLCCKWHNLQYYL